ncbi:MAG TPA: hypothetical protein VFM96_03165 [Gaiellaceae bacterium]|nr:hypothetical protein [Gaiellaceae bacterium]
MGAVGQEEIVVRRDEVKRDGDGDDEAGDAADDSEWCEANVQKSAF